MKKVCLQFENISELLDFMELIQNINCEINHQRLTLICEITDKELALALNEFHARLVEVI